jgi:hypothetical protein
VVEFGEDPTIYSMEDLKEYDKWGHPLKMETGEEIGITIF